MSDALRLVDAHHHVWNLDHRPQPWLDEAGHEPIRRIFGLDDLRSTATRLIAGRQLRHIVQSESDPEWLQRPPLGRHRRGTPERLFRHRDRRRAR
ncbi:hypothetical protein [Nonomuraea sp. NPDC003201]